LCRTTAVRIRNISKECAVSNDILLKMPNGILEPDKPFKVFDMKKFQQNMNRELKRPVPDRNKLVRVRGHIDNTLPYKFVSFLATASH
jgi:hypothetical protein